MGCGPGNQTRSVVCYSPQSRALSLADCLPANATRDNFTFPAMSRECNAGACDSYMWSYSAPSQCSVTCGVGRIFTRAVCRSVLTGDLVPATNCDPTTLLPLSMNCTMPPCVSDFQWQVSVCVGGGGFGCSCVWLCVACVREGAGAGGFRGRGLHGDGRRGVWGVFSCMTPPHPPPTHPRYSSRTFVVLTLREASWVPPV